MLDYSYSHYLCLLFIISPIIKYGGEEEISSGIDKHLELNHKMFKNAVAQLGFWCLE
jgi:hypothetical protein